MSTRKNFKKAILATIPFLMILIIAFSCRKDNFIDETVPEPANPGTWIVPYVFPDKPVQIMSPYEISSQTDFPGNMFHELGEGLGGTEHGWKEWAEGGLEVANVLWEIYDYKHTEARFDDIDKKLDKISGQITLLDDKMNFLQQTLQVDIANLTSYEATINVDAQISQVITAMGSGSTDGFMYYSKIASLYKDQPEEYEDAMQDIHDYLPTYTYNVYHQKNPINLVLCIQNMHDEMCTSTGTGENALHAYANSLIAANKERITDSASAMNAYLYFESYFLKVVNYQFQAATIYMNAAQYLDSVPDKKKWYARSFWDNTFSKSIIADEVNYFLQVVDYLVLNLSDYRTQSRYTNDMNYANAGLAPDNVFYHVLARSQFLANLLYDVSGVQPAVISGHFLIPAMYTSDGSLSPESISLTLGASSISATGVVKESQIPYTSWELGSDAKATCAPDNHWNTYRFNTSDTNIVWPCEQVAIQVNSDGQNKPWKHYADIKGTVTPMYYNPRDPSKPSKTKTDSCNIQFAYFSASWQWGHLLLSDLDPAASWKALPHYFDFLDFDAEIDGTATVPLVGTTDAWATQFSSGHTFKSTGKCVFTHTPDLSGTMTAIATTTKTSDYFVFGDGLNREVNISGCSSPVLSVDAWALCNASFDKQGKSNTALWVSFGTQLTKTKQATGSTIYTSVNGDVLKHKFTELGKVNSAFGICKGVKPGDFSNIGFQYYYQTSNIAGSIPVSVVFNQYFQIIYQGFYSLS